jgi:hypothetical protein
MGTEIFQIGDGSKAARLLVTSGNEWTSAVLVQGHQKLNVGITVGDQVSDLLSQLASAGNYYSAAISALASIYSGTIYLQRRMPEETLDSDWRDVDNWAIASTAAGVGGSENITALDDPESVEYRAGVKADADVVGGTCMVRIGTS